MILAELEVWHTRPLAPTRRSSLGNLVLPVDPAPGFGGLLLGAVVAGHIRDVPEELVPDVHRLIDQIDRDQRVVQPRLRHRFQVDRHGLALSTHRLVGDGEEITFDFDTTGTGLAQVLGAVYAVERLDPASRHIIVPVLHKAMRWRGPSGRRSSPTSPARTRRRWPRSPTRGRGRWTSSASRRQRHAVQEGGHRAVPAKMRGVHPTTAATRRRPARRCSSWPRRARSSPTRPSRPC